MNNPALFLIISTPLFVCLFWALCLLPDFKKSGSDKKILAAFMFNSAVMYLTDLLLHGDLPHSLSIGWVPFVDVLRSATMLMCYPLFFIYIVSLTGRIKNRHLLLFAPAVIQTAILSTIYIASPWEVVSNFLNSVYLDTGQSLLDGAALHIMMVFYVNVFITFVLVIIILVAGYRLLIKYMRELTLYFSDTSNKSTNAIKMLLFLFVLKSSKSIVGFFLSLFSIAVGGTFDVVWTIINTVILFVFGYVGKSLSFNYSCLEKEMEEGNEILDDVDERQDGDDKNEFKSNFDYVMTTEKLYLNPELKVSDLAKRFNTNSTYIHGIIALSGQKDGTFLSYVNRCRLNHCLKLMQEYGNAKDVTNYAIASGFSSRSAFYRTFKKEMNMTPTQYIKKHSLEGEEE